MTIEANSTVLINDQYAAGVTWRRIVARGSPATLALVRAREEKATRYSHNGTEPVVGLVKLKGVRNDAKIYSLARIVCLRYPVGSVYVAIQVAENKYWISGVRDGVPVAGYDEIVSETMAIQKFTNFCESQSITEPSSAGVFGTSTLDLPGISPLEMSALVGVTDPSCEIQPLRKSIPKPVLYLAILAGIYFVGDYAFSEYKAYQKREEEKLRALQEVDPVQGWQMAYKEWFAAQKGYDQDTLIAVRDEIYALPENVGGWSLKGGKCSASDKEWRCALTYARSKLIHESATNATFERARRTNWKVLFRGNGDELEASYSFKVPLRKLTPKELLTLKTHQIDTYSDYQLIAPAFSGVLIGEFKKEEITGPMTLEGQPMPKPKMKGLEDIFKQDISASGPLRNVEFFTRGALPVFWNTVEFNVSQTAPSTLKTDVKVSQFMSVLKGVTYAKAEN